MPPRGLWRVCWGFVMRRCRAILYLSARNEFKPPVDVLIIETSIFSRLGLAETDEDDGAGGNRTHFQEFMRLLLDH